MGIFKKMQGAFRSKVNAALDKAIEPEKELDMIIMELEEQRKEAIKELLSYKASAKQMEQSFAEQKAEADTWEKRAMLAVKKGDDETAKACLKRKQECLLQMRNIKQDQLEAASYAAELNASRKRVEQRLRMLKIKKGTMAQQIAAARSGTGNILGTNNELFEKFEAAEQAIEDEAIEAQVMSEMDSEAEANAALEAALLKSGQGKAVNPDGSDPLAQLKAKMDDERKLLKE